MMNFLKSFFSNEKTPEEAALQREHDVMKIAGVPDPESSKKESSGGCGGCGSCQCGKADK